MSAYSREDAFGSAFTRKRKHIFRRHIATDLSMLLCCHRQPENKTNQYSDTYLREFLYENYIQTGIKSVLADYLAIL